MIAQVRRLPGDVMQRFNPALCLVLVMVLVNVVLVTALVGTVVVT